MFSYLGYNCNENREQTHPHRKLFIRVRAHTPRDIHTERKILPYPSALQHEFQQLLSYLPLLNIAAECEEGGEKH